MVPIVTVAGMKKIDESAIAGDAIVGYSYMLRAGTGIAAMVRRMVPDPHKGDIAVICGKGNNGGDGFVAARLLLEAGYRIMCFGVFRPDTLTGEAKQAYEHYLAGLGNFLPLDDITELGDLSRYILIIDALLGIGLKGNPHGVIAECISMINQSHVPVLAVDTPSGLDCDLGIPAKPCIQAKVTVAMGFPKLGAYFYPGKACTGNYLFQELGYPDNVVTHYLCGIFLPTQSDFRMMLPLRKPSGSKFDHGVVAMLSGARGMTGSAILASRAAMRTGCGMVHLASPHSALPALSAQLTEVVLHGVAETEAGTASSKAEEPFLELVKAAHAVCVGPGISHDKETLQLVRELVRRVSLPIVLDADGINAYRGCPQELRNRNADMLITPHAGEWARLFEPLPDTPAQACAVLGKTAKDYGLSILYKGNPTIVATPEGKVYILPVGNSGMATAGSGDVLSGIIVSLIAQGCRAADAAILGAYLHGEAGNAAASTLTEYAMIAGDIVDHIYKGIKTLIV